MSELISYDLPFGVKIGVNDRTKDHEPGTPNKVATISSNLDTEISYESADTLEWFLMNLADQGLDMNDRRFGYALEATVKTLKERPS
jgi:hypothetical protein